MNFFAPTHELDSQLTTGPPLNIQNNSLVLKPFELQCEILQSGKTGEQLRETISKLQETIKELQENQQKLLGSMYLNKKPSQ